VECPECHAKLSDMAKFCSECGTRLTGSGSIAQISDSVVTHSPGAGGNFAPVINVSNKEKIIIRCPNCENEISNDNKSLKCMKCGEKFFSIAKNGTERKTVSVVKNLYVKNVTQPS